MKLLKVIKHNPLDNAIRILESMFGETKLVQDINSLKSLLVKAAQSVYNQWEQDEEGYDEIYGGGGICDDIAEAMVDIIHTNTNYGAFHLYNEYDCHTSIYVYDTKTKECYNVDISPYHYENGTAYTWKKIPDVKFNPNMVSIIPVDYDDFVNSDGDTKEDLYENDDDKQSYIDIISMDPNNPKYEKYKDILKNKYNTDFDAIYNDPKYLSTIDLNDIKTSKDFMNFDNWLKYAHEVSKKRGFIPMNSYDTPGEIKNLDQVMTILGDSLGFNAIKKDYQETNRKGGDIAHAFGNNIYYTEYMDKYYILHELGHVFQFKTQYEGIASNPAYAPTHYGTSHAGETFAEIFALYFINPTALKTWSVDIFNEMSKIIPSNWKNTIYKYLL